MRDTVHPQLLLPVFDGGVRKRRELTMAASAETSAWVVAFLTASKSGGTTCRAPEMSMAGALQVTLVKSREKSAVPEAEAAGRSHLELMSGAMWLPCIVPCTLPSPSTNDGGRCIPCSTRCSLCTTTSLDVRDWFLRSFSACIHESTARLDCRVLSRLVCCLAQWPVVSQLPQSQAMFAGQQASDSQGRMLSLVTLGM